MRVLSIQSSVVWGYVGNKTAVFPLQVNTLLTFPYSVTDLIDLQVGCARCRLVSLSLAVET